MMLQHDLVVGLDPQHIVGDPHDVFVFEHNKHFAVVDCPLGHLLIFAVQLCATPLSPFKGVLILARRCHLEWDGTSITERRKGQFGFARIPQTWSLWKTLQFLKSYWHSVHHEKHMKHPELYAPDRFPSVPRHLPYRGLRPRDDFLWLLIILGQPYPKRQEKGESLDSLRRLRRMTIQFFDLQ